MNTETKTALLAAAKNIHTALEEAGRILADAGAREHRNGNPEGRDLFALGDGVDYLAGDFLDLSTDESVAEVAEDWAYALDDAHRAILSFLKNAESLKASDAETAAAKERKADEQFRADLTAGMREALDGLLA